ncbi:MAG: hypothetical protein ACQEQG_10685 [Bacillota bacterium]
MKRELLIIIFLVVTAVLVNFSEKAEAIKFQSILEQVSQLFSHSDFSRENMTAVQRQEKFDFAVEDFSRLSLVNPFGSIEVRSKETDRITISAEITVLAAQDNVQVAEDYLEQVEIMVKSMANLLELEKRERSTRPGRIRGVIVDYLVVIPDWLDLALDNRHGSIRAADLQGDLEVTAAHCKEVILTDIGGRKTLDLAHSHLELKEYEGPVNLYSEHSEIAIEQGRGDINLDSAHDTIEITSAAGRIRLDSRHSHINLRGLTEESRFKLSHGRISLSEAEAPIRINSSFADVQLGLIAQAAGYEFDLSSKFGRIRYQAGPQIMFYKLKEEELRNEERFTARTGEGRNLIYIGTEHADVEIDLENL